MKTPPRLFGYFPDEPGAPPVLFIKHQNSVWHVGESLEEYGNMPPPDADDLGEITDANEMGIIVNGEIVHLTPGLNWQIETLVHHQFAIIRTGEKVFIARKVDTGKYDTPEVAAAEAQEMKKRFGFSSLVAAQDDDWMQDVRVACRKPRK
jgi:hypothetical protein